MNNFKYDIETRKCYDFFLFLTGCNIKLLSHPVRVFPLSLPDNNYNCDGVIGNNASRFNDQNNKRVSNSYEAFVIL